MATTTVGLASEATQDLEVSVVLAGLVLAHSLFMCKKLWKVEIQ